MIASTTKINEGGYCSSNQFEGSNGRVRGVSGAGAINPPIYCKCVTYLFVVDIGGLNLSLTTPNKKSFNLLLGLKYACCLSISY